MAFRELLHPVGFSLKLERTPGVKTEATVSEMNPRRLSNWQSLDFFLSSDLRLLNHYTSLVCEATCVRVMMIPPQSLCGVTYTEAATAVTLNCLEACLQVL